MKSRIFASLLAMMFCLGLCGCAVKESTITTITVTAADSGLLYDHGLELAELLEEMVNSPEYLAMMTGAGSVEDLIAEQRGKDFSSPQSAYRVALSEDAFQLLMNVGEMDMDSFSEPMQAFLLRRIYTSVPTMLNSFSGTEVLAASSICTASDVFVGESIEQGCYLVYLYDESCPVIVSFYPGEGYVEASATLLLGNPISEDSLEAVNELFSSLGAEGMHVEKLDVKAE